MIQEEHQIKRTRKLNNKELFGIIMPDSFCFMDSHDTEDVLTFYQSSKINLIDHVKAVLEAKSFTSAIIVICNNDFELVPHNLSHTEVSDETFSQENSISSSLNLKYNVEVRQNNADYITIQKLDPGIQILPYPDLILRTASAYLSDHEQYLYVHFHTSELWIKIVQSGRLLLLNRFEYHTAADALYFISLCVEKLNLNLEEVNKYFSGNITFSSPFYQLLSRHLGQFRPLIQELEKENDHNFSIQDRNRFVDLIYLADHAYHRRNT